MDNKDEDSDRESEELPARKEGSGQIPSRTNPRGAGRPTEEWRLFKREQAEFQAWQEARARGEFASTPTIIERLFNADSGRGEGDGEGDTKGYLERAFERLKLAKVFGDFKLDKVEELFRMAGKYVMPYIAPVVGGGIAVYVGATGLYVAEEINKTDVYTLEQWNNLSDQVQLSYHTINGVERTETERAVDGFNWLTLISPIFALIPTKTDSGDIVDVDTEIVKATRKMFPQIIHTVLKFQEWFTGTVEKIQKWLGVDDFPLFKMQNMFYYHVRKYFKTLSKLFNKIKSMFDTTATATDTTDTTDTTETITGVSDDEDSTIDR